MTPGDATAGITNPDAASPSSLCAPFVAGVRITGASISVFDPAGRQSTVCTSDPVAARIDELQFEHGHGPQYDVVRTARAVSLPDVDSAALPFALGAEFAKLGVAALFALPLVMGAVTIGVVSLYRLTRGDLTPEDHGVIRELTAVTAARAVQQALSAAQQNSAPGDPESGPGSGPEMRREVHQATGILMIHLDTDATEAFARLRARAFATERSLSAVARDVVTGALDFRDLD